MLERLPYFQDNSDFQITDRARNGVEALEILRTKKIDVVVTDIRMPMMDGIALLKIIQEEHLCGCTIFVSEYSDFEYAKQGILNGAFDYLLKPVDNAMVQASFERIRSYLNRQEQQSRAEQDPDQKTAEKFIFYLETGDTDGLLEYSKSMWGGDSPSGQSNEERILSIRRVLDLILQKKKERCPWLTDFLPEIDTILDNLERSIGFSEDPLAEVQEYLLLSAEVQRALRFPGSDPMIREIWFDAVTRTGQKLDLEQAAKRFHIATKYFSSKFKKDTGVNYSSLLQTCRMEKAKILLRYSTMRITEIAMELCYTDKEYFSRVFRNYTGVSPSQYRETHLKKRD